MSCVRILYVKICVLYMLCVKILRMCTVHTVCKKILCTVHAVCTDFVCKDTRCTLHAVCKNMCTVHAVCKNTMLQVLCTDLSMIV